MGLYRPKIADVLHLARRRPQSALPWGRALAGGTVKSAVHSQPAITLHGLGTLQQLLHRHQRLNVD